MNNRSTKVLYLNHNRYVQGHIFLNLSRKVASEFTYSWPEISRTIQDNFLVVQLYFKHLTLGKRLSWPPPSGPDPEPGYYAAANILQQRRPVDCTEVPPLVYKPFLSRFQTHFFPGLESGLRIRDKRPVLLVPVFTTGIKGWPGLLVLIPIYNRD